MFNATVAAYPYYGENHATALKLSVDEAALALTTGQPHTRRGCYKPNAVDSWGCATWKHLASTL